MATFTLKIFETLTLDGDDVGSSAQQTITGINYVDNRFLNIPTGSLTTLFSFDSVPGAGTFVSSSFKYGRITNNSLVPVKLVVSSSIEASSYLISAGSSFILSTSKITGSVSGLEFNDIVSIKAEPSGSSATLEYYILTT